MVVKTVAYRVATDSKTHTTVLAHCGNSNGTAMNSLNEGRDAVRNPVRNPYGKPKPTLRQPEQVENAADVPSPNEPQHQQHASPQQPAATKPQLESKENTSGRVPSSHNKYWTRLPSNTISITSAEILTVPECCQHASLYHEKQVRVTGILRQRTATEEGQIILELIDPLAQSKPSRVPPATRNTTPTHRSPWLRPKRRSVGLGGLKRSPVKPAIPLVRVIANPRHVARLETLMQGTLVMVMGRLVVEGTRFVLEARLVQSVRNSDMTMHVNALKARRRLVHKQQKQQQEDSSILRLGCGPPPYDNLEQSEQIS